MLPNYRPALELAQQSLRSMDPRRVAQRSGADLLGRQGGQEYHLKLLGREYSVPLPEALVYDSSTGALAGVSATLIVLHYLATADGSPVRREWILFRNTPGGDIYEGAFRRQCIEPLVAAFGRDPETLSRGAEALGGARSSMGDLSYVFQALPHLPMACVLWLPDEEQGAEVSLLFDAVAPSYLPTEDLAALGRTLAFSLIRLGGNQQ